MKLARWAVVCVFCLSGLPAAAETEKSAFEKWWHGDNFTGDWFGVRDTLADRGVVFEGHWRGILFGILASQNGAAAVFDNEIAFGMELELGLLTGWEGLNGLQAFGEVRWRDSSPQANPNTYVEADSLFNPTRLAGGVGWRLMNFGLRYTVGRPGGPDDNLVLSGGWLCPQEEFIHQPMARLFANNALGSAEGLGGNIPFSSSFSTWGGTVRVRPSSGTYTKGGLFMAYPNATSPDNRGLKFRGDSQPDQNSLFFIGEAGVAHKLGSGRLPGNGAAGGYYYGGDGSGPNAAQFGFYVLGDQMLWREPTLDGVASDQGLSAFFLATGAPEYNNDFPFYVQGGLVYRGLLPRRDRDQLMLGGALGFYSQYDSAEARAAGQPEPTQTLLLETGYRVQITDWAFAQPFAQYVAQPDGTSAVANAATIGLFLGVDF